MRTRSTVGTSSPREATSVASSSGTRPPRKASSAARRSLWGSAECRAAAGTPRWARRRARCAQPCVVAQKTRAERGAGGGAGAVEEEELVEEDEAGEKSDGGKIADEEVVVDFSRPAPPPTPCRM